MSDLIGRTVLATSALILVAMNVHTIKTSARTTAIATATTTENQQNV
jgi:hypothetical protein